MDDEKIKASTTVATISTAGASVGAAVALATGISFTIPMAIGAGISCLAYGTIKAFKKD